MKKRILASLLVASVFTLTVTSSNALDYVCRTQFNPGSSNLGSEGWLKVYYSTNPNCAVATTILNYCTDGATHAHCAANGFYHYSLDGVLMLWNVLSRAGVENSRVWVKKTTCNDGNLNCGAYVQVYAN